MPVQNRIDHIERIVLLVIDKVFNNGSKKYVETIYSILYRTSQIHELNISHSIGENQRHDGPHIC